MISDEMIKRIKELSRKNYSNYKHFFDSINSPKWLGPLADNKFFSDPPNLEEINGAIRTPIWPEAGYLKRIAKTAPDAVMEIILKIPDNNNPRVHEDLILASIDMPPVIAAKIVPKAINWIENIHSVWFLPDKYSDLIIKLAQGGEESAALLLATHLFSLVPNPRKEHFEELGFPADPEAKFEDWNYKKLVEKVTPIIAEYCSLGGLRLFCDLLNDSLEIGKRDDVLGPPAIEDNEQNRHQDDPKDTLSFAVRNLSERIIDSHGKKVLEIIESYKPTVFKRICLHLRRIFPDVDLLGTNELLSKNKIYDDILLYHERYLFLCERFGTLSKDTQLVYLKYIEEQLEDKYKQIKESGEELSEEHIQKRLRRRKFDRLYPIREYLKELNEDWLKDFEELGEEFKPRPHQDFLAYICEPEWVSPKAPKSKADLQDMQIDELAEYLSSYRSIADDSDDFLEGLGLVLKEMIFENPLRFISELEKFFIPQPEYVEGILEGFREVIKKEEEVGYDFWKPVLEMCLWAANQERDEPIRKGHYADLCQGWGWTRSSIASLLDEGLKSKNISIPFEYRDIVWSILKILAEDPNPGKEKNEEEMIEYYNQAINTVRGKSIVAVIHYANWIYLWYRENEELKEKLSEGFEVMPEVRELLNDHLNIEHDPSLAIRSIYGLYFLKLLLFDKNWTIENINSIFSLEADRDKYFNAAWSAYVIFTPPHPDIFKALKKIYHHAVTKLGSWPEEFSSLSNPDDKLAEHLMNLYCNAQIVLDDSILQHFFEKAPGSVRKHALFFIGRELGTKKHFTDRTKKLWEFRLSCAKEETSEQIKEEISAFGYWFSHADYEDDWFINHLTEAVEICGMVEDVFDVLARFVKLAKHYPQKILKSISIMLENERDNWFIPLHNNDLKSVMLEIANHSSVEDKKMAVDLVNKIGAMGYEKEYADIYKELKNSLSDN